MLSSMTAYGRHAINVESGTALWELKAVNNRYLDIVMRLPDSCRVHEAALKKQLGSEISRGRVEVHLHLEAAPAGQAALTMNETVLAQLGATITEASRISGARLDTDALRLLAWPGVLKGDGEQLLQLSDAALAAFPAAIADFQATRQREGEALQAALQERLTAMREHVEALAKRRPDVLAEQRQRFTERLDALVQGEDYDASSGRLEQELLLLAQKLDVEEELDRLRVHLDEFENNFKRDEPVGRRLDFLLQEINRETNTLGSKSSDSETTAHTIDMKVLIEQMREQVQNVE